MARAVRQFDWCRDRKHHIHTYLQLLVPARRFVLQLHWLHGLPILSTLDTVTVHPTALQTHARAVHPRVQRLHVLLVQVSASRVSAQPQVGHWEAMRGSHGVQRAIRQGRVRE